MNRFTIRYRHYIIALSILLGVTILSQLFHYHLEIINVALIHLLPIVVIALRGEMRSTMVITTMSVIDFDFLYVPPQYSFHVHDLVYIWSFIIFYVVGYVITVQARRIHANEIKQMLLHTLSHDLKTPLASIMGNTTLLLENKVNDEQIREKVLNEIKHASDRMDRLIGTLLDSARLKNAQGVLQKEWCDIEDIIGVALQEFETDADMSRLHVKVANNINLFWADSGLLVRLLVNLLENAFKYSNSSQQVHLTVTSTKKYLKMTVYNESEPISPAELANIFERFYRLDNTADINGSGIGLAICKDIVSAHEGTIEAINVVGGISFEVKMPILEQPHQYKEDA